MNTIGMIRKLCVAFLLSLHVGVNARTEKAQFGSVSLATVRGRCNETQQHVLNVPRGGLSVIPAGYNPFGYKVTELGMQFLSFEGSLDSEVGRFLASLKAHRKRRKAIKEMWLEIVRSSKKGLSMRIYRDLDKLLDFCLKAGLLN